MKPSRNIVLEVTLIDIGRARCGNRRQCVIAQAMDRQFKLGGKGYIRVDANGAAFTRDGKRHLLHLPSTALRSLRKFDEIGEAKGEMEARKAIRPSKYTLRLIRITSVPPKAGPARMAQIYAARAVRRARERAEGILPKVYKRYVGISPLPTT